MSIKLTDNVFVLLDTETTHQDDPKVVEIAGMKWSYNGGFKNCEIKETYVNPGCKIHPASMAIHHIRNEYVKDAPKLEDIDAEWDKWVGDDIIAAYNSDYDKGVLINTSLYDKRWFDVYRMAMHFWSLGDENEDGFALTSLKQQELRYWLDIPQTSGDAHRASADIQVTAHILHKAIEKYLECGMEDNIDYFLDFINGPICHQVIPIGGFPYSGKTPDQVQDWALKKAFDPSSNLYDAFKKFNIHECLLPEYIKRFGKEPSPTTKTNWLKV